MSLPSVSTKTLGESNLFFNGFGNSSDGTKSGAGVSTRFIPMELSVTYDIVEPVTDGATNYGGTDHETAIGEGEISHQAAYFISPTQGFANLLNSRAVGMVAIPVALINLGVPGFILFTGCIFYCSYFGSLLVKLQLQLKNLRGITSMAEVHKEASAETRINPFLQFFNGKQADLALSIYLKTLFVAEIGALSFPLAGYFLMLSNSLSQITTQVLPSDSGGLTFLTDTRYWKFGSIPVVMGVSLVTNPKILKYIGQAGFYSTIGIFSVCMLAGILELSRPDRRGDGYLIRLPENFEAYKLSNAVAWSSLSWWRPSEWADLRNLPTLWYAVTFTPFLPTQVASLDRPEKVFEVSRNAGIAFGGMMLIMSVLYYGLVGPDILAKYPGQTQNLVELVFLLTGDPASSNWSTSLMMFLYLVLLIFVIVKSISVLSLFLLSVTRMISKELGITNFWGLLGVRSAPMTFGIILALMFDFGKFRVVLSSYSFIFSTHLFPALGYLFFYNERIPIWEKALIISGVVFSVVLGFLSCTAR